MTTVYELIDRIRDPYYNQITFDITHGIPIRRRTFEVRKRLEGRKFSEISESIGKLDESHRKHTKGIAAKVVETDYFGIPSNSSENPDFENLGLN